MFKKIKHLSAASVTLVILSVALIGCGTHSLESGGAYAPASQVVTNPDGTSATNSIAPDYAFFEVDSAFDFAHATINAAFQFEYDNRAILWKISPDIKHSLDKIRPEAEQIVVQYSKARAEYKKHPIPGNLSFLQASLQRIQALGQTAQAAIPKGKK